MRIARAAARAGRDPSAITLLAVSKAQSAAAVAEAARAGQNAFGENYAQEALDKMQSVTEFLGDTRARALEWHFVGPLQSNKTRIVAERFAWVHSLERAKIAQRLSDQRPAELSPLAVLIQVNISGESSKSGIAPQAAEALVGEVSRLPRLHLRGLMAVPEPTDDASRQRSGFAALRALFERLRSQGFALDSLSMGMSADLEAAIAEGATIVRVGTAIFGERPKAGSAA